MNKNAARDLKLSSSFAALAAITLGCARVPGSSQQSGAPAADRGVNDHAQRMVDEGRRIFRYDTFGSEAFWTDVLQLHKAIAGSANGGVGGGRAPRPRSG